MTPETRTRLAGLFAQFDAAADAGFSMADMVWERLTPDERREVIEDAVLMQALLHIETLYVCGDLSPRTTRSKTR